MRKILLLATVSVLGYSSGVYLGEEKPKYEEKILTKKECKTNKNKKEICVEYGLTYPIISNLEKSVLKEQIENVLKKHIKNYNLLDAKDGIENISDSIDFYEKDRELFEETYVELYIVTDKTFTLKISNSMDLGGVHPNTETHYENYSVEYENLIELKDIFVRNFEDKLNKIAENYYRKVNNLMPEESLSNVDWLENSFVLPETFAITNDGLEFLYNPYEIKAYVFGETSFILPYQEIDSILKPNQYIPKYSKSINKSQFKSSDSYQYEIDDKNITLSYSIQKDLIGIEVDLGNIKVDDSGVFSISFPQITSKESIKNLKDSGFESVTIFPKGVPIKSYNSEEGLKIEYLLIEAKVDKKSKKSPKLNFQIPITMDDLYINSRFYTETKDGDIISFPMTGVNGQQGFYNHRTDIKLR